MCIHLQSGHILELMGGLIKKSFNLSIIGILMVLLEVERPCVNTKHLLHFLCILTLTIYIDVKIG